MSLPDLTFYTPSGYTKPVYVSVGGSVKKTLRFPGPRNCTHILIFMSKISENPPPQLDVSEWKNGTYYLKLSTTSTSAFAGWVDVDD